MKKNIIKCPNPKCNCTLDLNPYFEKMRDELFKEIDEIVEKMRKS